MQVREWSKNGIRGTLFMKNTRRSANKQNMRKEVCV
jgi:hypothetical protein